jgi:outer membrane biosynthesis protein TonB
MPDLPQPTEDARDPAGPEYPGEKVGPPGEPDGVDDGTGKRRSGPLSAPTDDPLPVGGDVHAPELLQRVEPVYTEAARRAHIEGIVILEAIITTSGEVEEIRVLRSANPLLDEAAERAALQ